MGDGDDEDMPVPGHSVDLDASSDDSCLDDIETELYSQIYYASGDNSGVYGDVAASTSGASQLGVVTTGNSSSSSYSTNNRDCTNPESLTSGQNISIDPCTSGGEPAASSLVDSNELSGQGLQDDDADLPEDPDEYIILSSDDDSPDSDSRQGMSTADSCLVVDSEDSDVYVVDDNCEFEFNILSEVPKCPTTIGTLADVLASLPAHGWHIIAADKYPNTSRSRYYNVQCRNCNEKGHAANECRKPKRVDVCILCGIRGHTSWSCKQQLCLNCCQFGHTYSSCSSPHRKHSFCQRCRRRGHAEKTCAELWRQFHWAVHPEAFYNVACKPPVKTKVNKLHYCANCARRGHFTFECRAGWSNPFRPALSVFVNEYKNQQHGGKPVPEAARKPRPSIHNGHSVVKSKQHCLSADRGPHPGNGAGSRPPRRDSVQLWASVGCVAELENGSGGRKQKRQVRAELYLAKRTRKEYARSERLDACAFPGGQDEASQWATPDHQRGGRRGDGLLAASTPIIGPWEHHQPYGDGSATRSGVSERSPRPSIRQIGRGAPTGNGSMSKGNAAACLGQHRSHVAKGTAKLASCERRPAADVAGGPSTKRPRAEHDRSSSGQGHTDRTNEADACSSARSSARKPKKEPVNTKSAKQQHFSPARQTSAALQRQHGGKQSSKGAQRQRRQQQEAAGSSGGAALLPVSKKKKKSKSVKHCFTVTDGDITSFHVRTPSKHIVRFSY